MDAWRRSFLDKLREAQSHCAGLFEDVLDRAVAPAFDELASFLRDNGFTMSIPLREPGRRSFKYELAENAYLLVIFRFLGVGEFELQTETFVPGAKPVYEKKRERVADVDRQWAQRLFQAGLDRFIDQLANQKSEQPAAELATV